MGSLQLISQLILPAEPWS